MNLLVWMLIVSQREFPAIQEILQEQSIYPYRPVHKRWLRHLQDWKSWQCRCKA
nr:MAG TPA: hypothetical protein [Caudoviricetes sp.]